MTDIFNGKQTQFYIDIIYGAVFALGFAYLLFIDMDGRVAAFQGGIILGYFFRVWENMSVYERILEEQVAEEAEEAVAEEVQEQVPSEAEEQVAEEVEVQVADRVPKEAEEHVADEIARKVPSEAEAQVAEKVQEHVPEQVEVEVSAKAEERVADEIERQVESDASQLLDNEIKEAFLNRLADEDEELAAEVRNRLSNS